MKSWAGVMTACLVAGCATGDSGERPAVIKAEHWATIKPIVAAGMGTAKLDLGEADPREEPLLVVLPPKLGPMESRSTVTPAVFDITTDGEQCTLKQRRAERVFAFPADYCEAL